MPRYSRALRIGTILLVGLPVCLSLGAVRTEATAPLLQITIESGSPYFFPSSATVTTGTPIRWDNPTASHHTATHDTCLTGGPCAFDSGSVAPSDSYTLPSLPPGRYPYHCSLHPIMRGTLIVIEPTAVPSQT